MDNPISQKTTNKETKAIAKFNWPYASTPKYLGITVIVIIDNIKTIIFEIVNHAIFFTTLFFSELSIISLLIFWKNKWGISIYLKI